MYKENNPKKKNVKALFLLIVLTAFGVVVFKFTKINKISADTTQETEASSCSADVVDKSYEESPVFINLSENGSVSPSTTDTKNVLGAMTCSVANNSYTASSACTLPSSTGKVSLQGWVSSTAEIDMTSITVPVRLLSGIFSVHDSNRKITMLNPVYKPAGEQFDDRQILVNTTPGDGSQSVKANVLEGSVQKDAYSVRYTISTEGDEGGGDAGISEYSSNDCGELCNNPDNSNPEKSNLIANNLKNYFYDFPGEKDKEEEDTVRINGLCEGVKEVSIQDPSVTGCFSFWKTLVGTFGSLFPSSDWTSCNDKEDGCVKSEDIVVKMSPMFKETNSFMNTRNKTAMDPGTASNYKSYYIVTNCRANVSGKSVDVKCLWDMSYLFEELKAAEYDDAGESDTPSETQYIRFLQEESTNRTDPLYTM